MGEIKKAMRPLAVMEKRIVSNLTYLLQNRWVEQDIRQFVVQPGGRPVMTRQVRYRISSAGGDRYEGPSVFQRAEKMAGINITNIQGVTVIGHDNVVNTQFAELFRSLETRAHNPLYAARGSGRAAETCGPSTSPAFLPPDPDSVGDQCASDNEQDPPLVRSFDKAGSQDRGHGAV